MLFVGTRCAREHVTETRGRVKRAAPDSTTRPYRLVGGLPGGRAPEARLRRPVDPGAVAGQILLTANGTVLLVFLRYLLFYLLMTSAVGLV